jgi:hypothetical protein
MLDRVDLPSKGADFKELDEVFIPKADLSRPVIMLRMQPESFRLMDGNHRIAKARRQGVKELPAYYLTEAQHRQFFLR